MAINDSTKAKECLHFLMDKNPSDTKSLWLLAYFHLIKGDTRSAINLYTRLLGHPKFKKKARKILSLIANSKDIDNLIITKGFLYFCPLFLFVHVKRKFKFLLLFILLLSSLIGLYFYFKPNIQNTEWLSHWQQWQSLFNTFNKEKEKNKEYSSKLLKNKWLKKIDEKHSITQKDFNDLLNKMQNFIALRNINLAIMIYNRILSYSPPLSIEEKAKILYTFIPQPEMTTFKNTINFNEIYQDKSLYLNTYWKFQGIITKIKQDKNLINFNFSIFIGKELQDLVTISYNSSNNTLKSKEPYEILAKLKGFNKSGKPLLNALVIKSIIVKK